MAISFRSAAHSTEVRTRLDVRVGWLADVEIDEATGRILRIGIESLPHLPLPLVWIPANCIYEWTEKQIRVEDAAVKAAKEHRAGLPNVGEMPATPSMRYDER